MSVRMIETDGKTSGQGWQVSRRAFLAQTSALLVAMGVPAHRAQALAGQLYQTKDQALAGSGYVDEIVMALSSKVSDAIDSSGAASVQLLVKKLYEDAGLAGFDAQVGLDDYLSGAAAKQTVASLAAGEGASAAEVIGRVVANDVLRSIEKGLQQAHAKLDGAAISSAISDALNGSLTTEQLAASAALGDPLFVFVDPERALLSKMLAPLHESRSRIEAVVPNGKVSVGLQEDAGKLHGEVLNVVVSNWLEAQYDEEDFSEARELAQTILAKRDITLPASTEAAKASLGFAGESKDVIPAVFAKLRALVNDPAALHGTLEQELAESQAELDEILTKLDSLSKELTGQPLQFAENVPGTRYVLADLNGVGDKVAQEMVDELNRLNDRAGELSKKVVELQFQMEDLNVQGSDGKAVEEKLLALEHQVVRAAEVMDKAVEALQKSEAVTAKTDLESVKASIAKAVEEAFNAVELNKELARADISPIDWAVQKSATAQFLVQSAQMTAVLAEGLQLAGGSSALAESFKMLGHWNHTVPVDSLDDLCKAQLALRTDKALAASAAFASQVKENLGGSLDAIAKTGWSKQVANVVAGALAQAEPKLEATVASLGLGANATVADVIAAVNASLPSFVELKNVQENVFVAGVAEAFANAVLAAAKSDEAIAKVLEGMTAVEIAGANVHLLAFQVLGAHAADPVAGAIANYLKTMVDGAFGEGQVSLAAYADVDAETVRSIVAKAERKQSIVASAKEPLSEVGHGLVGLLLPNLLASFSAFSRDVVVRQAKTTLKIDVQ